MPKQSEQEKDIPQALKEDFAEFEKLGFKRVDRLKPGEVRVILNPPRRMANKFRNEQAKSEE